MTDLLVPAAHVPGPRVVPGAGSAGPRVVPGAGSAGPRDGSASALTPEQLRIVEQRQGGVLVLAPAGTGKTTVLTERVARALADGIAPERILCVTFTNRAARELRGRLAHRFPDLAARLAPRTFHQLCADILRREAKRAGLMVDFAVCDEHESQAMLRRILGLSEKDGAEAVQVYHRLQEVKAHWPAAELRWPLGPAWARAGFTDARQQGAAQRYERGLSQWQLVDFADLVLHVRALLASRPDIREYWEGRYDLVQVDEIQDTHVSEYEIVATLARRSGNLALFGDLDQTIYEWRGAEPSLVLDRFRAELGPIVEVTLRHNHRATRALIAAADTFARSFTQRETCLEPAPDCPAGEPIHVQVAETVSAEAAWIAERIAAHVGAGAHPASIGVLAPTNWYAEEIAHALDRRGIRHLTAARIAFFRRPAIVEALGTLRLLLSPGATNDALREWERSTQGLGADVLKRLRADGEPVGLRLVDLFRAETFDHGEPHAALLAAYDRGSIVVFDLETTGLDEHRDEIVEVAAVRLERGRIVGRFEALVRPTGLVGASERIHGLSDDRLAREGQPSEVVLRELLALADGAMLVGHNIGSFDLRMLAAQAARHGLPFAPAASADTFELARRFVPDGPYTLAALAAGLRLLHLPTHRAAADVATTVELLARLIDRIRPGASVRRRLVATDGRALEPIARRLQGWRALVPTTRPAELLARVLDESGQRERAAGVPGTRHDLQQLEALFAAEDDPARAPAAALRDALDRAALANQVDLLSQAEERVPVLTIHQAKGLEFDVVFVAGCSDGDLPRRRSVAEQRLEEERRLFYVALTRAKRTLVLTHAAYSDRGQPRKPSRFLATLGSTVTGTRRAALALF